MPETIANGLRLSYEIIGEGEPVLLICGTGQSAFTWQFFQVPALVEAGYQVVTFDNRGMPPSDCPPPPYTVFDMAADAAGLIEALGIGPCHVAGLSLGAFITQELALSRPDLVRGAVMMGTFGRQNAWTRANISGWVELDESGITLPRQFDVTSSMPSLFSPHALVDDERVNLYFEFSKANPPWEGPGKHGQHTADRDYDDRLEALAGIQVPCLVVAFELDVLTPAPLGREVADTIPGCRFLLVGATGHAGPMEAPDVVNPAMIEFFDGL